MLPERGIGACLFSTFKKQMLDYAYNTTGTSASTHALPKTPTLKPTDGHY